MLLGDAIWDADQGLPSPYIVEDGAIDGVMVGLHVVFLVCYERVQ